MYPVVHESAHGVSANGMSVHGTSLRVHGANAVDMAQGWHTQQAKCASTDCAFTQKWNWADADYDVDNRPPVGTLEAPCVNGRLLARRLARTLFKHSDITCIFPEGAPSFCGRMARTSHCASASCTNHLVPQYRAARKGRHEDRPNRKQTPADTREQCPASRQLISSGPISTLLPSRRAHRQITNIANDRRRPWAYGLLRGSGLPRRSSLRCCG